MNCDKYDIAGILSLILIICTFLLLGTLVIRYGDVRSNETWSSECKIYIIVMLICAIFGAFHHEHCCICYDACRNPEQYN